MKTTPAGLKKALIPRYSNKRVLTYYVDGNFVRNNIYADFTEGGHGYVYDFIPKREVWLDRENIIETKPILVHELHERHWMAKGLDYDHAHDKANVVEQYVRQHPRQIKRILKAELGNNGARIKKTNNLYPKRFGALKHFPGYRVLKRHDDGDLTIKSDGKKFLITTTGEMFEQLGKGRPTGYLGAQHIPPGLEGFIKPPVPPAGAIPTTTLGLSTFPSILPPPPPPKPPPPPPKPPPPPISPGELAARQAENLARAKALAPPAPKPTPQQAAILSNLNTVLPSVDASGNPTNFGVMISNQEATKLAGMTAAEALGEYVKLGVLPKGTTLITDVDAYNKQFGTTHTKDAPYALPDEEKAANKAVRVEGEQRILAARDKEGFETSLKTQPQYLQDAYAKGGIEEYNKAVVVYNAFIDRWNASTEASFEKKLRDMPQELQDAYKKGGIPAYNAAVEVYSQKVAGYNLAASYYYEAADKEFRDKLREEWPALYKVYNEKGADAYDAITGELQKDHPSAAVLSKYLSPAELKAYNEPKMSAGDKYSILEQSGLLPKDSTKYAGQKDGQPIISWGQDFGKVLLKAKPQQYLLIGAEMVVPGLYTGLNWNKLSTTAKIIYIAIDALTLFPFTKAATTAARGVSTAGKLERLAAIGTALGREAVAQIRAPVDIILPWKWPGMARTIGREIRGLAELIASRSRLSTLVATTADGVVQIRIGKDIETEAGALRLRDKLTELAANNGGRLKVKFGSKEVELARSPLMREIGGGLAHTSPDIEKLLESDRVKFKPGLPEKEQGLFFATEAAPEFTSGSAFDKGVVPVASKATEAVLDVAKYRIDGLVLIDKAPVRALDFTNARNVPGDLARSIQNYVRDNDGIVYGSLNEYTKLKKAKLPNDLDLVFSNQQKAIDDIIDIAKREGYQVRRAPHAVEIYRDGKWVQIADIADIAEHKAMLPAGLSQKVLTRIDGIRTETMGEQYLRQSFGAVSKTEKAEQRAKRVNDAAKEVKAMLKKAGAEKRMPGVLIVGGKKAAESVPTEKLFHTPFEQGKVMPAAELERKFKVGAENPRPIQHFWARFGPRADRYEIELAIEKPLTNWQIAKLKAETILEFAKAPFKQPIKFTERAGVMAAEDAADIDRGMTKLEDALREAGDEREADALRRIAKEIEATRRAPGVAARVTSEILAARIGRDAIKRIPPAQRRIVERYIAERQILRPLSERFRPAALKETRAPARLPGQVERPPRNIARPGTERITPPRVTTERSPRETTTIPPRMQIPRVGTPRIEPPRPPRVTNPIPPRVERPPVPPRIGTPKPPEPPRVPRPVPPRPPESPRPPKPPRESQRPFIPGGKSQIEWTPEEASSAVAFEMGKLKVRGGKLEPMIIARKAPYRDSDVKFFIGNPPLGMKVHPNQASAYKTIQQLYGKSPSEFTGRQGFARYQVSNPSAKPGKAGAIKFGATPRIPDQTKRVADQLSRSNGLRGLSQRKGPVFRTSVKRGSLLSRNPIRGL